MPNPPHRRSAYPAVSVVLIVGGPLLSVASYGMYLTLDNEPNARADLIFIQMATVAPFVSAFFLRERLVVRLLLAFLFAFAGAVCFLCAGFPMWLLAGAPGFSPG